MSCSVCGRTMCDHSPTERGQTQEEMTKDYLADAPVKWKIKEKKEDDSEKK